MSAPAAEGPPASAANAPIVLENVSVRLGSELILGGVTLDVHRGEFLALIGPSGGGKTNPLAANPSPAINARIIGERMIARPSDANDKLPSRKTPSARITALKPTKPSTAVIATNGCAPSGP